MHADRGTTPYGSRRRPLLKLQTVFPDEAIIRPFGAGIGFGISLVEAGQTFPSVGDLTKGNDAGAAVERDTHVRTQHDLQTARPQIGIRNDARAQMTRKV